MSGLSLTQNQKKVKNMAIGSGEEARGAREEEYRLELEEIKKRIDDLETNMLNTAEIIVRMSGVLEKLTQYTLQK